MSTKNKCGLPINGNVTDYMNNKTDSTFPLWFGLIVYWLLTYILLIAAMNNTHGHFGYPLDDTYIHMAIAKHFVNDGSWGVVQNVFSSSTSSPLWTLLIAITYKIFGVNDWTPFLSSLLFGSLTIYYCYRLLRDSTSSLRLLLSLILISLFVPLPIMTLTGMEHSLQCILTLLLLYFSANYLSKTNFDFFSYTILIVLANLTTITRYEGVFIVLAIMLLLFFNKRFWEGLVFTPLSLFLVTIYGFVSIANGWYFLPNSVLLKGNVHSLTLEGIMIFIRNMLDNFYTSPHVIVLLIANLILYLWLKSLLNEKEKFLLILSTIMTFAHMIFAGVAWFFRYEAYIVLTLSVVLIDMLNKYIFHQVSQMEIKIIHSYNDKLYNYGAAISLTFLFFIPLGIRTGLAFGQYPLAVTNIYEQQYQMGKFLQKYYPEKCVAANDIGAISYLADICIIDLYGLANMDVIQYRLGNSYTKNEIHQLISANDVQVVVIYTSWFNGQIPNDWIEIGKWKIQNNVVCGDDEITYYAPNTAQQKYLTTSLIDFSHTLPPTVSQSGIYVSP